MSIPRITEILETEVVGLIEDIIDHMPDSYTSLELENDTGDPETYMVASDGGVVVWVIVEDGTATLYDGEDQAWAVIIDELDIRTTPLAFDESIEVELSDGAKAWVMYRAG